MSEFSGVQQIPLGKDGTPLNGAMVRYGDDRSLAVRFFQKPDKEPVYIEIIPAGGRTVIHRASTDADRARFPLEWERYIIEQGGGTLQIGTPLSDMTSLSEELQADLKGKRITSIEQLASLNEHAFQAFGIGIRFASKEAKQWLADRNARDTAALEAENAELKKALAGLLGRVEALEGKTNEPAVDSPGRRSRT